MAKFGTWIKRFNERLALVGTGAFGTMWAFYIFFIWGILGMLPFLPKSFTGLVLLVSSAWIQLWALPLLAVGNTVMNRSSEKRAKEDHLTLRIQLEELKDLHQHNEEIMDKLDKLETMILNLKN